MILFDHLYDATQAAFLIFNMEAEWPQEQPLRSASCSGGSDD